MEGLLSLYLVPALFMLLHLVGLVLAIVYWRRSPLACALLAVGVVLNMAATVARVPLQMLVRQGEIGGQVFGLAMMGISAVNWVGYAVMIAAVVIGRPVPSKSRERSRYQELEDEPDEPIAPIKDKGSTGIQEHS